MVFIYWSDTPGENDFIFSLPVTRLLQTRPFAYTLDVQAQLKKIRVRNWSLTALPLQFSQE